jgi:DNA polymerase-1
MLAFWLKIYKYPTFDTMLAHHLIFPGTPKSLGYLASMYAKNYCYWKEESQDWDAKSTHTEMWEYNCKDTWYTFEIAQVLKALIKRTGKEELYAFQMEQWELYIETMAEGVRWDREKAQIFRTQLLKMANELGTWLLECMPEDIRYTDSGKPWFSSNTHLQWIFYDLLGVKEVLHKQTKKRTLGKESFEILKKDKPWLGPILDRMKLLRSVNVFSRNFLDVGLGMDGRMHSSFNVGGTETFRLSSSSNAFDEGMNLQNLPKKEED